MAENNQDVEKVEKAEKQRLDQILFTKSLNRI